MSFNELSKEDIELYKIDHKVRLKLGLPLRKLSSVIPFGYVEDSAHQTLLTPIDRDLQLLYEASTYVGEHTTASVVRWLNSKCKESKISIPGFNKLMKTRIPDSRINLTLKERFKVYDGLKGRFKETNPSEERV